MIFRLNLCCLPKLLAVYNATLGGDAPFLTGIADPLPQVGPSSVGRSTIPIIKHHSTVFDDDFIVTAASWDDSPLLAGIAE